LPEGCAQDEPAAHRLHLPQAELPKAWRLRCLSRVPPEYEAPKAAALRKKAQLAKQDLRRSYGCRQRFADPLNSAEQPVEPRFHFRPILRNNRVAR
jgi:hypothetical protein